MIFFPLGVVAEHPGKLSYPLLPLRRQPSAEVPDKLAGEALGHLVRGGQLSAFDRVYTTRLGFAAIDLLEAGKSDIMVALRGEEIASVPVEDALKSKRVPKDLLKVAQSF